MASLSSGLLHNLTPKADAVKVKDNKVVYSGSGRFKKINQKSAKSITTLATNVKNKLSN